MKITGFIIDGKEMPLPVTLSYYSEWEWYPLKDEEGRVLKVEPQAQVHGGHVEIDAGGYLALLDLAHQLGGMEELREMEWLITYRFDEATVYYDVLEGCHLEKLSRDGVPQGGSEEPVFAIAFMARRVRVGQKL